jgi:hypothetical protein
VLPRTSTAFGAYGSPGYYRRPYYDPFWESTFPPYYSPYNQYPRPCARGLLLSEAVLLSSGLFPIPIALILIATDGLALDAITAGRSKPNRLVSYPGIPEKTSRMSFGMLLNARPEFRPLRLRSRGTLLKAGTRRDARPLSVGGFKGSVPITKAVKPQTVHPIGPKGCCFTPPAL